MDAYFCTVTNVMNLTWLLENQRVVVMSCPLMKPGISNGVLIFVNSCFQPLWALLNLCLRPEIFLYKKTPNDFKPPGF